MIKLSKGIPGFLILITAVFCSTCSKDEIYELICGKDGEVGYLPCFDSILPNYSHQLSFNPKFNNTDTIFIPAYQYYDGNSFHNIKGDESLNDIVDVESCCDLLAHIDYARDEPFLEWSVPINYELMAAAIFDKQIKLTKDGLRIQNTDDIVWTWNSGLDSGSFDGGKMQIKYSYGKMVHSGEIADGPVVPLVSGKIYSWFVWAWNANGTKVIASSREIPFIVNGISTFPIGSVLQIEGRWTINKITASGGEVIVKDDFPINEIFFIRYCNVDHQKWEDEYCVNASTDTLALNLDLDTLHLTGYTEIPYFFNPKMHCDELFNAKCHYNGNIVTVEFLRDVSFYIPGQ